MAELRVARMGDANAEWPGADLRLAWVLHLAGARQGYASWRVACTSGPESRGWWRGSACIANRSALVPRWRTRSLPNEHERRNCQGGRARSVPGASLCAAVEVALKKGKTKGTKPVTKTCKTWEKFYPLQKH